MDMGGPTCIAGHDDDDDTNGEGEDESCQETGMAMGAAGERISMHPVT
jgi:hypothetical protein